MAFWHNETCEGCGHVVDSRSDKVKKIVVSSTAYYPYPRIKMVNSFYCGICAPKYDKVRKHRYFREVEVDENGKVLG